MKRKEIKGISQFVFVTHAGDLHAFRLTLNEFIFLEFVACFMRLKSLSCVPGCQGEGIGTKQNGFVLRPLPK